MNTIQILTLKHLLKKPTPSKIPRSGIGAESVDCNVVYLRSQKQSWTLLLEKICHHGVTGKYWNNNEALGAVSIPFNLMGEFEFDITHFYGPYDLRYHSINQYLLKGIVPINKAKILIGKGQQFLFNKKELIRSERIEVLKIILEKELDEGGYETSSLSLSTLLHTEKWVFHPDKTRQQRYYNLLLESLKDSGDLIKTTYAFKLSSKALITISQFEEDQKKHRENIQQSKSMRRLTFALIFVGLIQASVTLYGIFQ